MSNTCSCYLNVHGPAEDLAKFRAATSGPDTVLTFAALVPRPADAHRNWREENWGTWDCAGYAEVENEPDGSIAYYFITPWAPPLRWLDRVAPQFPSLRFLLNFGVALAGYRGDVIYERGELVSEEYGDIEFVEVEPAGA